MAKQKALEKASDRSGMSGGIELCERRGAAAPLHLLRYLDMGEQHSARMAKARKPRESTLLLSISRIFQLHFGLPTDTLTRSRDHF